VQTTGGTTGSKAEDQAGLTGKASRAIGWSFISTVLTRLSSFGVGVLLARLLGPSEFGAYAVALVALFAMQTFNELGVSLAIVRWESDPAEIVPTVATISIVVSAATYIGCFFGAHAYAAAMGAPRAASVVQVLAISILIDGFVNAPSGLLQRQFRQGQIALAVQVGGWLGTGVTVWLAWSGHGAISLAIGQVAGAAVTAVIIIGFAPGSVRVGFDPTKARKLLRFGLPLAGASLISFAVGNVDQLVVGHLLGAKTLGLYVLAFNVASWPLVIISRPVGTVAPAVFSRLQHNLAAMRGVFLSVVGLVAAVALPACMLLSSSARPLMAFVYGARWLPAAHALLFLGLLSAVRILFEPAYDFLVVLARSKMVLLIQVAWLVALVPAVIAGAHYNGIHGAALAEFVVAVGVVLPCYVGGLKSAGVGVGAILRRLLPPVLGGGIIWLAADGVARFPFTDFTALAITGAVAVVVMGTLGYSMRSAFSMLKSPPSAEAADEDYDDYAYDEQAYRGQAYDDRAYDDRAYGDRGYDRRAYGGAIFEGGYYRDPAYNGAAGGDRGRDGGYDGSVTEELSIMWGVIDAPRRRDGQRRRRDPDLENTMVLRRPNLDETMPFLRPVTYDPASMGLVHPDRSWNIYKPELSETSPLYRKTVSSRRWDPAAPPARGPRRDDRSRG
jgi:O-antigen/teichoic acid export membrane protein